MRDVLITGVGLVTSLGEGLETHLASLSSGIHVVDEVAFAPYPVHPLPTIEWDRYIPKKSDQRQMEPWQRIGCHVAGLALDSAGAKDDIALKAAMHLIVAAGGGERDQAVDGAVLAGLRTAENPGAFLNERLMSDLRPTLFLAQLSNLLAGNIAIVHGVTGASRTFMGEEQAGIDSLRIAQARIAAGQNDIMLVGGASNGERADMMLVYAMGGALLTGPWQPVASRNAGSDGFVMGSGGAFLVLESGEHAAARGATPLAKLQAVQADQPARRAGSVETSLAALWQKANVSQHATILSGSTGIAPLRLEEQRALAQIAPGSSTIFLQDYTGHLMEAQSIAGVALAAGLVSAQKAKTVAITSVGHKRGEGLAIVTEA